MKRRYILLCMFGVTAGLTLSAIAQERANSTSSSRAVAPAPTQGISAAPAAAPPSAMAKPAADGAEKSCPAVGRRKEIPHQLRALPSGSAQVSAASHGHRHTPHEGPGHDHR